jgi:hypothetical protein
VYAVARRRYDESVVLRPLADEGFFLSVRIFRTRAPVAKGKQVADLLGALAPLERTAELACLVEFSYPSQRWSSLIRLPLQLSQWQAPFDEVRGVRLVKLSTGNELEYSAILDRPDNRNYSLSLAFASQSPIEPSVTQRVLAEAAGVARLFIRPKGEE